MMIKKETYIAPAMEVILITPLSAVLLGAPTPLLSTMGTTTLESFFKPFSF